MATLNNLWNTIIIMEQHEQLCKNMDNMKNMEDLEDIL